jgi:hypothetical protein
VRLGGGEGAYCSSLNWPDEVGGGDNTNESGHCFPLTTKCACNLLLVTGSCSVQFCLSIYRCCLCSVCQSAGAVCDLSERLPIY